MIKVKNPNVGDRVMGKYIGILGRRLKTYKGEIIAINKRNNTIHILRDDGKEGSGKIYKGNNTWVSGKRDDGFWGGNRYNNFLYIGKITNWKERLR